MQFLFISEKQETLILTCCYQRLF